MHQGDLSSHASSGRRASFHPSIGICDEGLVFGTGTLLMRMTSNAVGPQRLAIDDDRARMLALLSVVYRRPVGIDVVAHVEAASAHWQRGDKALANIRIAVAGLPQLKTATDAARLRAAEYCLDEGLSPHQLMKELGLDASALGLAKYNRDEPRDDRGRWTREPGGGVPAGTSRPDGYTLVAANERYGQASGAPEKATDADEPTPGGENSSASQANTFQVPILPIASVGGGPGTPQATPPGASALAQVSTLATQAATSVGPGSGPVYGTAVHKVLSDSITALNDPNLTTEQSYLNGEIVNHGKPGSVRLDIVEGPRQRPTAVYDLKTGSARLTGSRVKQLRLHLPENSRDIPIKEIRP